MHVRIGYSCWGRQREKQVRGKEENMNKMKKTENVNVWYHVYVVEREQKEIILL